MTSVSLSRLDRQQTIDFQAVAEHVFKSGCNLRGVPSSSFFVRSYVPLLYG